MKRADDFEIRREHLKELSDQELEERFWELCEKIVDPIVELAKTHTSPSIERSVLLRMGFSSIESRGIAERIAEYGLLKKGAGNVVYRLSRKRNIGILEAGRLILGGGAETEVKGLFKGGETLDA
jgi:D-ornithine 4,5-aminomutase subunit alpha